MQAVNEGLLVGVGNSKYDPNKNISNAEFLTGLVRVIDKNVEAGPKGEHWYDMYIASARFHGILSILDEISPDEYIKRQDIVKYICRAIYIQPDLSNELIFNDLNGVDSSYINALYKEYLIEGMSAGLKGNIQFGYDTVASRAQLATILIRIEEYKADPVVYKTKAAAERQAREEAYKQQ